jgi:PIN domain nuclease of toxin-antitoxin system
MRLLLDTHTWLWNLLEPARLSRRAARALRAPSNEMFISAISVWEPLLLARKGRVVLEPDASSWLRTALSVTPAQVLPIDHAVALRTHDLAGYRTRDPADRFIVATAVEHGLTIVTADRAMRAFSGVPTLW